MRPPTVRETAVRDAEDLYRQPGPITSLYLGLNEVDDPHRIDLRWHHLRGELSVAGTPEADLALLDEQVTTSRDHRGPRVLAAFCAEGRLLASRLLEQASGPDRAVFGPLPAGGPLLAWAQQRITYLLVVTDHTGADITVRQWPAETQAVTHVEGSNDDIESHAADGWAGLSQSRYQRRAIDSWEHNAVEGAAAVTRAVDESHAEVVLITGDIRSVLLLHEALPAHVRQRARVLDEGGTRGDAGISPAVDADVLDLIERTNTAATNELLHTWRDLTGQAGPATTGARATAAALHEGKVATLLVDYDEANHHTGWLGPEPAQVAVGRHELAPLGVSLHRVPLADALIRAAVATGADVHMLPPNLSDGPPDGVAGILRYG